MTAQEILKAIQSGQHELSNAPCNSGAIRQINELFGAAALDLDPGISDSTARNFHMVVRTYYVTHNGVYPNKCSAYVSAITEKVAAKLKKGG